MNTTSAHNQNEDKCYAYADEVITHEGYYTCDPTWTLYNTNQCKKWTGNHWSYKDATYHQPTYGCPEGYHSYGDSCRKEVDCNPTNPPVHRDDSVGAPICTDNGENIAPTVTKAWRDGKGNIDVQWTLTDTSKFVIYYGLSGKELGWNTGDIHGYPIPATGVQTGWDYTIHKTPNVLLDVQVCSVGSCGEEKCSVRFIDP